MSTVTSSPWTEEDRALMLAYREHVDGLCKGCGHPKATAWHPDNGLGSFGVDSEITCWGCTAKAPKGEDGTRQPVTIPVVVDYRDYTQDPLPPMT